MRSILFLLYIANVTTIAHKHGIDVHSCVNDTQLHFNDKSNSCPSWLPCLALCINEIDKWMSANWLNLNADKIQFIWLGTKQQLKKFNCQSVNLNEVDFQPSTDVTCLRVIFDSKMNFEQAHLTTVRKMLLPFATASVNTSIADSRCYYNTHSHVHHQLHGLL